MQHGSGPGHCEPSAYLLSKLLYCLSKLKPLTYGSARMRGQSLQMLYHICACVASASQSSGHQPVQSDRSDDASSAIHVFFCCRSPVTSRTDAQANIQTIVAHNRSRRRDICTSQICRPPCHALRVETPAARTPNQETGSSTLEIRHDIFEPAAGTALSARFIYDGMAATRL